MNNVHKQRRLNEACSTKTLVGINWNKPSSPETFEIIHSLFQYSPVANIFVENIIVVIT